MVEKKEKKRFVPLFTESGGPNERLVVLLPGRHACQCLAVRHQLVGNCTKCGRIVCQQEGSGSCFFCGNMVVTPDERKLIDSGTKAGIKLVNRLRSSAWAQCAPAPPWCGKPRRRNRRVIKTKEVDAMDDDLMAAEMEEPDVQSDDYDGIADHRVDTFDAQERLENGLVKAVLQRDRLLHFDATTVQQTRVIDDELDYFVSEGSGSAAVWLDPETRARVAKRVQELRAQRQASRLESFHLCIDFANKRVFEERVQEKDSYLVEDDSLLQKFGDQTLKKSPTVSGLSDPLLNVPNPEFVGNAPTAISKILRKPARNNSRVLDSEQARIVDRGLCMSLHQPWASLLVRGVKRDEGRKWYSAHRGPLWIAAAAKIPDESEIKTIEMTYIKNGVTESDLPKSYPTGVLVGCVNVEDVLPQQEYRSKHPTGESNSPFVFVCTHPRELLLKLPVRGEHKIYKLDPILHTSARENLT